MLQRSQIIQCLINGSNFETMRDWLGHFCSFLNNIQSVSQSLCTGSAKKKLKQLFLYILGVGVFFQKVNITFVNMFFASINGVDS
jgi:hypothetical protein